MNLTPLQKRAERKSRNHNGLDMNLVALIDIFTILLFFLLSSASEMETLSIPRTVQLPESLSDANPRPTVVVLVNDHEIVVDGRTVALVSEVMAADVATQAQPGAELIAPLHAELVRTRALPNASATITIMGDKDIPYRLLRKVMSTCAQAEYTDVAFAVRTRMEKVAGQPTEKQS
jgi:biopolymer transport protein ExbD